MNLRDVGFAPCEETYPGKAIRVVIIDVVSRKDEGIRQNGL